MAEKSAFEKIHIDESEKSNFEGLLEQLNLPPGAITFISKHIRLVQISTAVVVISVVTWALYGSYRDNRIENASSALSAAMALNGESKIAELSDVVTKFDGTTTALWAKMNLAHELAQGTEFEKSIPLYIEVREESDKDSSLLPLLANSLGQLYEKTSQYDQAISEYDYLKTVKGYEGIGYLGLGRVYELKAEKQKALTIYEQYQNVLNEGTGRAEKILVEEKIARIKASL